MTLKVRFGMSDKKQQVWSGSFSPAKAAAMQEDGVEIIRYFDENLDKVLRYVLKSEAVEVYFLKDDPTFVSIIADDDIHPAELIATQDELCAMATQ